MQELLAERAQRQFESLNLWEPLLEQDRFHRSVASERVVRGGWRSGKSATCAVEVARAALGRDPHGKYPTNKPLVIWIVAWEESNIGRTIHRLLFRAGAFKIIKDQTAGKWRAYRPYDAADKARENESKPAPPLIPPKYYNVRDWAWKDKGRRIFAVARLLNGTEIFTFNSGGDPPTGDDADLVWIDEDLQYEEHLKELEARLAGVKGRLIWSAKPRSRNQALLELCERARTQLAWPAPDVQEFQLVFSRNPHIDQDEKRKLIAGWSPEERTAFDYGEFTNALVLFYPNFSIEVNGIPENCDPYGVPYPDQPNEIDRILMSKQIPANWSRYMVVDPGQQVCAVLFGAVPPPSLGEFVVAYDELYLQNCDPVKFGEAVGVRASNQSFRAFLIDEHAGLQRMAGVIGAISVKRQYAEQLRKHNIRSELTGHNFFPGNDDIQGGTNLVKSLMSLREDGTSKFRILRGACPHLEHSLSRYRKKIINGVVTDQPARGDNHLADCVRYLLSFNPRWYKPRPAEKRASLKHLFFVRMGEESRSNGKKGPQAFNLGPGKN